MQPELGVSCAWRDVIYKGNDNYYLEGTSDGGGAPAGGGTFLAATPTRTRHGAAAGQHLVAPGGDL